MRNFTVFDKATGRIEKLLICQPESLHIQYDASSQGVVSGHFSDDKFFVIDSAPVELPHKPSETCTFNWQTKLWEDSRTLADLKVERREYVNAERLKANQSHFSHLGKQIATDALSRGDIDAINGQVNNTGAFPGGWPGAWKCLDNTWLPIETVEQWRAMYSAMVGQGTANFARAQELKAQIEAATTPEQVAAVAW